MWPIVKKICVCVKTWDVLQTQQTPNPLAQDPAEVPPLPVHSVL
jgi:hypothetical protein